MATDVLRRLAEKGMFTLPSKDGDLTGYAEKQLRELAAKRPEQVLDAFVSEIAVGMLPPIVNSFPELGKDGAITVRQIVDWRINAEVSKAPPYEAVVSTNLVTFIASMLSTLHAGIGINLVDDEGRPESPPLAATPVRIVARDIKRLLDGFIAERQVAVLDADATGARYMIHFRLLHCALSWALGHELAHIAVTESRRRRIDAPFQPLAASLLDRHFAQLLGDTRFTDALGPLNEAERLRVYDRWLTEINADIMGASLACGYQKDRGPSRGIPGVVGFTMFAIHLVLMSQYLLATYTNLLNSGQALASRTHPPMDFRMHCVLTWMYKDKVREAAEGPVTYVQEVFKEVLRQSGRPDPA